jgi:hypothetical protein
MAVVMGVVIESNVLAQAPPYSGPQHEGGQSPLR